MKAVRYKRVAQTWHVHAARYATCIYVPEKKITFYTEKAGSFGGSELSFTEEKRMLDEGEKVFTGCVKENEEGLTISEVVQIEIEPGFADKLLTDMRESKRLLDQIETASRLIFPKKD